MAIVERDGKFYIEDFEGRNVLDVYKDLAEYLICEKDRAKRADFISGMVDDDKFTRDIAGYMLLLVLDEFDTFRESVNML